MTIEQLYELYKAHPQVQTDTRKLQPGQLFFCLKGDRFNGNAFAKQALEQGAAAVVVDEETGLTDERVIRTDDVLRTLQTLALHHRRQFNIPFLAITGSNGKTTTKELVHAVLSSTYTTYTTEGNLNNHIGVPLTLLNVRPDARMAVVEMGANHQREIAGYCTYTLPTHALINNVGKAHLEGFGGIEGVKKGKGELYDFIRDAGGMIFINNDFDYLQEMSRGIDRRFSYGTRNADVTGELMHSEPFLVVRITSHPELGTLHTRLVGDYNLPNVLAAVAVGLYFGVAAANIHKAIEAYTPSNSRSQLVQLGSNQVILDAYNANPTSMRAAIENLVKLPAGKKVVILGSMAELGEESRAEHAGIIALLQQHDWTAVALVGEGFREAGHPYLQFDTAAEARDWFSKQAFEQAHILVKGSRSMQMEQVLQ
ncbi:MAG TPA: UDP-N-acetylmuramoyl-tripeptide--D-alanyl-D-alanine ligase [Lacibacter sp.]|nr:UDP-N-acetylmuramoyl-tripeptide--D-alanyl-D-alanine ligase [Lacibacter sp.]HMO88798.1 UDP-N-acetylmuramoyl-tripeptide--D-alanyl-D-alanine ligase [Lacibacter sp.]HMP86178.1 UDP-N-acetylmuramoyl-tripeptide--D-alanyl-D-alanine ligase [Lacibacter sp.]